MPSDTIAAPGPCPFQAATGSGAAGDSNANRPNANRPGTNRPGVNESGLDQRGLGVLDGVEEQPPSPHTDRWHADRWHADRRHADRWRQDRPKLPESTLAARLAAASDLVPIAHLLKAGMAGDADAEYLAGLRYLNGRGVPKDIWLAARLIEDAARAGAVGAIHTLGILRFAGIGVARDIVEAYRCLAAATAAGYPGAGANFAVVARWLDDGERAIALARQPQFMAAPFRLGGCRA